MATTLLASISIEILPVGKPELSADDRGVRSSAFHSRALGRARSMRNPIPGARERTSRKAGIGVTYARRFVVTRLLRSQRSSAQDLVRLRATA
jgi:hypothetical protein